MQLLPPENLSATYNKSDGSIQITWQIDPASYTPTSVTVTLQSAALSLGGWTTSGPATSYTVAHAIVSQFAGTVGIYVVFVDAVHGLSATAETGVQVPGSAPPAAGVVAPVITSFDSKPATISAGNSITVNWSTPTGCVKFFIKITQTGAATQQKEVDSPVDSVLTAGSLTVPTIPGVSYTFEVQGVALDPDLHYIYSPWGPSAGMTASPNLRSLRQFLQLGGVNPAGASLRSLMPPGVTLKQFMDLA